jgi:hypothetical protein
MMVLDSVAVAAGGPVYTQQHRKRDEPILQATELQIKTPILWTMAGSRKRC